MKEIIKNSLKFLTCGSVDDGKSTLIGRMLYESGAVYEDQIRDAVKSSQLADGQIDYSLFVDGLLSEREQGITIDVAYRYFNTSKTKFIIADSPGHKQYTRNMTVAASNSDAAVLLIDASRGIQEQTLRHSYVLNLFGIKNVVIAVNKMDKVGYSKETFDEIVEKYKELTRNFAFEKVFFIPVSAINGDNITKKSVNTQWYADVSLLEALELIASSFQESNGVDRILIQNSIREDSYGRGYQAFVSSGGFRIGDEVVILPARKNTKIKTIIHGGNEVQSVEKSQSITVFLADEIDVTRGCVVVKKKENSDFIVTSKFRAYIIAFHSVGDLSKEFIFAVHHVSVRGVISKIEHKINFDSLEKDYDNLQFDENQIFAVDIELATVVGCDLYLNDHKSGSFIVVDPTSHQTIAAGIITENLHKDEIDENDDSDERYLEFIRKFKNLLSEYKDVAEGI